MWLLFTSHVDLSCVLPAHSAQLSYTAAVAPWASLSLDPRKSPNLPQRGPCVDDAGQRLTEFLSATLQKCVQARNTPEIA